VGRALLLIGLAVVGFSAAAYAAPPSVQLEELTWTEVKAALQSGTTTIIIPAGGTEQSGPHMALGKHNVRARYFAQKIAAALGNALVAPVVSYVPEGSENPPAGHMRFPGTITIPEDVFEKTLESAAEGFRLHGFRNIVFLGDHGGYRKSLERVVERLNAEFLKAKSGVRAYAPAEYYDAATRGFAELLRKKGYTEAQIGVHAGLGMGSVIACGSDEQKRRWLPAMSRFEKEAHDTRGTASRFFRDVSHSGGLPSRIRYSGGLQS